MSPDDYIGRTLRHRGTGAVAVVGGQIESLYGNPLLRLKFGDGSLSRQMNLPTIEAEWEWVDGITAGPAPVVALPENVVPFKRAWRVAPIEPGSGDAA